MLLLLYLCTHCMFSCAFHAYCANEYIQSVRRNVVTEKWKQICVKFDAFSNRNLVRIMHRKQVHTLSTTIQKQRHNLKQICVLEINLSYILFSSLFFPILSHLTLQLNNYLSIWIWNVSISEHCFSLICVFFVLSLFLYPLRIQRNSRQFTYVDDCNYRIQCQYLLFIKCLPNNYLMKPFLNRISRVCFILSNFDK